MGKRVQAKDFIDDEASADEIEDTSPGASDAEEEHEEIPESADEDEAAIKELILQRDLLFQWHMTRDPVPNRYVRFVEYKPLPDKRHLIGLNTPHGEIQLPVTMEHTLGGVLNIAFLNDAMSEQSASKCVAGLRKAVRHGLKKPRAAPRAKPAVKRAKKARARGGATKNASAEDASGAAKA